jgi:hypothetical protein
MANGTKYRVKQIGDNFYPQRKQFLFWRNISVRTCSDDYYGRITNCNNKKEVLCFNNFKLASEQITNHKNNYLRSFLCLGHIVRTYFNKNNRNYYYVDTTTYKLYSNNSEQLCELITTWEDDRKKRIQLEREKRIASRKVTIHEYVED